MKVEKLFRQIPIFENMNMDLVLFESHYPVLFTCTNGNDVYLFSCCLVNSKIAKWIGTKTDYKILIELLSNQITIQEAFLNKDEKKVIIEYNGESVICKSVEKDEIPVALLPTAGEYMDAEDDEFSEEIAIFKSREKNSEYKIIVPKKSYRALYYAGKIITLPDEYYETENDEDSKDNMLLKIRSISQKHMAYAY